MRKCQQCLNGGLRTVAEGLNGQEAVGQLRRREFNLVLLDVNRGGRSGLETMRRISAE